MIGDAIEIRENGRKIGWVRLERLRERDRQREIRIRERDLPAGRTVMTAATLSKV